MKIWYHDQVHLGGSCSCSTECVATRSPHHIPTTRKSSSTFSVQSLVSLVLSLDEMSRVAISTHNSRVFPSPNCCNKRKVVVESKHDLSLLQPSDRRQRCTPHQRWESRSRFQPGVFGFDPAVDNTRPAQRFESNVLWFSYRESSPFRLRLQSTYVVLAAMESKGHNSKEHNSKEQNHRAWPWLRHESLQLKQT